MKILAVDFSTNLRTIALLEGPSLATTPAPGGEIHLLAEQHASSPQAACALDMIDAALAAAKVEREAVEGLAIGLGPGSYTGIRIAIALAQGWQLARPVITLGISGMDCLATQYAAQARGRFWVALDAQRGDFYLAGGEATDSGWTWHTPLHLASGEETRAQLDTGGVPIGPEIQRWFPHGLILHPQASTIGRLAWKLGPMMVPANELEPIYLREISYAKAPPPRQIPVA
jgi:tRNA threonylcarbamoyl adenosine modification protein YeaZ